MRGKKGLFLMVLFVLCTTVFVSADSVVTLDEVNAIIEPGEEALFTLNITNNAGVTMEYSIYSSSTDMAWSVDPKPLKNRVMSILPYSTVSTTISVQSLMRVNTGAHVIPLVVKSDSDKKTFNMEVYVGPVGYTSYLPSIKLSVDLIENIDPQHDHQIKLTVENLNRLNYSDLTLRIRSDMDEFVKRQSISLAPFEKKLILFDVSPNRHQQPKDYFLFFIIENGDETVKVVDKKVKVLPLDIGFEKEISVSSSFLRTDYEITFSNSGNQINEQEMYYEIGSIERFFVSTEPDAQRKEVNGSKVLAWRVNLAPTESAGVKVVKSYRLPFVFLILAILIVVLSMVFKSPVEISKNAVNVKVHQGAVSGFKVILSVKNTSRKPIKDVEVVDVVPHIGDILKDVDEGSIRPDKITRTTEGNVVKWKLSELEGLEERIISYHFTSRLNIVGSFKLPRAKVYFGTRNKVRVAFSNVLTVKPW